MERMFVVILIVVVIFSSLSVNTVSSARPPYTGVIKVRIYIGGYIFNRGSQPVPVNETDLLVFSYPLNTSDQRVLSYTVYLNNIIVSDKYINIHFGKDCNTLIINESYLNDTLIDPRENISAGVEYIVEINMTERRKILGTFLGLYPGEWSAIIVANETYIKKTGLWNFSNPLVSLLVDYMMKNERYNKTPYNYVLGLLSWFENNVKYSTRIPPRQPWEVIAFGRGDCDDQANLFITLLRAVGIPSYQEVGIVYISDSIEYSGTSANGYYKYVFKGGGGHGWVVAYIPPWGYLRIDLTFGAASSRLQDHILLAAYYNFPTVILEHVVYGDYTVGSAEFLANIEEKKLEEGIVVIIEVID